MVNFRVRDLDAMAAQLRAGGIAIKVDPQTHPNGHFARLHDAEGKFHRNCTRSVKIPGPIRRYRNRCKKDFNSQSRATSRTRLLWSRRSARYAIRSVQEV